MRALWNIADSKVVRVLRYVLMRDRGHSCPYSRNDLSLRERAGLRSLRRALASI
jgi:hypothetical protein